MVMINTSESQYLKKYIMPNVYGYNLLLLGNQRELSWIPQNRLYNFTLSPALPANGLAQYNFLPLRHNAIDYIFMPYILNNKLPLQETFTELHRCLVPEGKLFIWHYYYKQPLLFYALKSALNLAGFNILKTPFIHYGYSRIIEAQKRIEGVTPLPVLFEKTQKNLVLEAGYAQDIHHD